jgi:hypothetical protein
VTFVGFGEAGGRQRDVFQIGLLPDYARTYDSSDHIFSFQYPEGPKTSMSFSFDLEPLKT